MAKKDYYETLGIDKSANEAEIKSAFRKLAKQYHPDNKETGDESKFKEIGEAYAVLSDASKKQQYDQYGHAAFDGMGAGGFSGGFGFEDIDLSDILGDLFGSSFGGFGFGGSSRTKNQRRATKGQDTLVRMNLTFEEAVYGSKKEVILELDETCDECNGAGGFDEKNCPTCNGRGTIVTEQRTMFGVFQSQTTCGSCKGLGKTYERQCNKCHGRGHINKNKTIEINVPEGVDNGNQIRISGKGEAGRNGGPNGDIYIEFNVKEHPLFKREGDDIYVELPITIADAILGCKKEIPSLDGNIIVTIDSGTQSGEKLRLKNKGIKDPNSSRKGDMYVIINVIIPNKLDRKQKKLIEELDATDLESSNEFKNFRKYID